METSRWTPIIMKAISIMVSQIHDYAYMSAKAIFVAKEVLKILPDFNLKPLDYLRMKFEEVSTGMSLKQLIQIYEKFFLLKVKAKDLFQGHFFSDLQDYFYSFRAFHELITTLANDIDASIMQVATFKEFEKNLRRQFKSFNDGHENAYKILLELFKLQTENKGLPKDHVNTFKKIVQASMKEVESEISFLHIAMGVQDIEKFLFKSQTKFVLDNDLIIKDINDI